MHKLKLHWSYFKSTLAFNFSISVGLTFIFMIVLPMSNKSAPIHILYIYSFMFGGPFLDFLFKIVNRNEEFYFYYNRAITKQSLLITSLLLSITFGHILLKILHYAELA